MIKMKAMKDFRGEPGEGSRGSDRMVEAGYEFDVGSESRAKLLELRGLAVPVVAKVDVTQGSVSEPKIENKAADAGPLDSPGGRTGADKSQSSSPAAPAPKTRRSQTSKGALDL